MQISQGEHRVAVDGGELVYHVAGQGPVCLVHPGGAGAEWLYMRMPEVERHLTLVYLEPIGTGRSSRLPRLVDYSRERDAANLEAVRRHLGLERVGVLGHSYGGLVALTHALAHPEALDFLILYSTAATTGPEWEADFRENLGWFQDRAWYADAVAALSGYYRNRDDEDRSRAFRAIYPLFFADWDGRPELHWLQREARCFAVRDPDAMPPGLEARGRLGEIHAPTLILCGERDPWFPPRWMRPLERDIPGSRMVVFAYTGHMAHLEVPADFAEAIADFLADVERAVGRGG